MQKKVKNISVTALAQLIKEHEAIQLIDVREEYEHHDFNIGGLLLPLGSITQNIHLIEKEKPVIVYCRIGVRSQIAIQRLQQKYPLSNLINLEGGIESWKKEFPC